MREDLIEAIADQLLGVGAAKAKADCVRARLALMTDQFGALATGSPRDTRNKLVAIQDAAERAAKAICDAPDIFEEICRETADLSSTALALMLWDLAQRTKTAARSIAVRKVRSEADKKLCAWFAWQLFDELSDAQPTLTPSGPYIAISGLIAELLLGDHDVYMSSACRDVLEGRFPAAN